MITSIRRITSLSATSALVLLAVFLVPQTATAASDPPRKTFPKGVACPLVTVYASRGSGEPFDDGGLGAGSQIKGLYDLLVQRYGTKNVGLIANGYPAVPVADPFIVKTPYYLLHNYKPSVLRGAADAVADLKAFMKTCKASVLTLVVAGYSQGADVVRRALAEIKYKDVPGYISIETILMGDPNFDPKEDFTFGVNGVVSAHGTYHQQTGRGRQFIKASGLPAPPAIKREFLTSSWCHNDDLVCQRGGSIAEHSNYLSHDGFAMASAISTGVPWRVPIAFCRLTPLKSLKLSVSPSFFPALAGPTKGKPSSAYFITTVDDKRVDGRTVQPPTIGVSRAFTINLPDKNWHKVSVYSLGYLVEEKLVRVTT